MAFILASRFAIGSQISKDKFLFQDIQKVEKKWKKSLFCWPAQWKIIQEKFVFFEISTCIYGKTESNIVYGTRFCSLICEHFELFSKKKTFFLLASVTNAIEYFYLIFSQATSFSLIYIFIYIYMYVLIYIKRVNQLTR